MKQDHGIMEIGLRRTACLGKCPVYSVVIKSDGTFRYTGKQHVQRKGKHSGKVSLWSLDKLAEVIKETGFMALEDSYAVMITCQPTVYTTVVMDGVKKVVSNYGNGGPPILLTIEELIDKLLLEAEWDQASAAACA